MTSKQLTAKMASSLPQSCDTFVVMSSLTEDGTTIFGKNSDRPQKEVQEVVLVRGGIRPSTTLKCTYITIEESTSPVNDVVLSKPAWMWGAEMGANIKNVVIGNEAVWTNNNEGDGDSRQKRLLGMDLLRLGLERGNTAEEALNVITTLLEKYGQGGPCSDTDESHYYHNSFLIADTKEAWVLETSGKLWVAQKVRTGYKNISNGLTIKTQIDKQSANLTEKAIELGVWDGKGVFDFARSFASGGDDYRQQEGERLLREMSATKQFGARNMMRILRHKESHICRGCSDTFPTQGSQVSQLSDRVSVHWFTATPDTHISCFKPFIFTPKAEVSSHIQSPDVAGDREHLLYKIHDEQIVKRAEKNSVKMLRDLEEKFLLEVAELLGEDDILQNEKVNTLMSDAVDTEIRLYG